MIIIVGNHFFSFSSKKRATNKTGKGISLLNGFFSPVCVDLFAFVFNLSCCAMSKCWKCRKQVRSSFIVMIFVRKLKRDTLKYVIRNSLNSWLTIQCYSYEIPFVRANQSDGGTQPFFEFGFSSFLQMNLQSATQFELKNPLLVK